MMLLRKLSRGSDTAVAVFSERSLSIAGEPIRENCTLVFTGKSEFRNTSRRSLMLSSPPLKGREIKPNPSSEDLALLIKKREFSGSWASTGYTELRPAT
jgi:hypothetical protein